MDGLNKIHEFMTRKQHNRYNRFIITDLQKV